jgi:hypothetical protein
MELTVLEEGGEPIVEGAPGERFMASASDIDRMIEVCLGGGPSAALLYAPNLPPGFFDLSSGEAGTILQKLRNYRIRLAVVAGPGEAAPSTWFGEMEGEERRGGQFGVFESREAAVAWLERR